MHALEKAKILVAKLDRIFEELGPEPPSLGAEPRCPRRLHRVACEASEAARILEAYRRKAGLTPEGIEALERYEGVYDRASLMLLEHFSYPHAQPPPPEF